MAEVPQESGSEIAVNTSKPFKVCNKERTRKVGVVASNYDELKCRCLQKFCVEDISKFVIEEDGTEVDSEFLSTLQSGVTLMLLQDGDSWCAPQLHQDYPIQNADMTMSIIQSLREENKKRRTTRLQPEKKVKFHTVQLGWMNYSYRDHKYKLIKGTKDNVASGPRSMKFKNDLKFKEILLQAKATFFPLGKSVLGPEKMFSFRIGNYEGSEIDENVILQDYITGIQLVKPRIYLLSKEKPLVLDTDSDSDDFLPDIRPPRRRFKTETVTSEGTAMSAEPQVDFLAQCLDSSPETHVTLASLSETALQVQSAQNSTVNNFVGASESSSLQLQTAQNSTVNNFVRSGQESDTQAPALSPFVD